MTDTIFLQLAEIVTLATTKNVLKKAVFSKPADARVLKTVATPKVIGGAPHVQLESFLADNKAVHKNLPHGDIEALAAAMGDYAQINVITSLGECELRTSSKGKRTLIGGEKIQRKLEASGTLEAQMASNNKEKKYILDGSEPFLALLGVTDGSGRIKDKKQSKFRQINRFLELVRDVEDKLPKGDIRICDLCCGKSYLSFAVYHYFANIKKQKVSMTGIDLKSDVIENCSAAARELGFDGLEFVCADIRDYKTDVTPELVISLHACDIATDIVLLKAAEWQADVILSTPCCHHEMNGVIKCDSLSFITDYSMLRQKLCDAATDALRLKRLESQGYSTVALELIDPDETPKNVMLRAVRIKNFDPESPAAKRARAEYLAAKTFLCGTDADIQNYHF